MNDPSPITEPIELTYALHLMAPGRIGFRRWRWELWHGSVLVAAGWRVTAPHAQRALRTHASRYAHRLHGLHALRPEAARAPESPWHGQAVTVDCGALRVLLTPRRPRASPAGPAGVRLRAAASSSRERAAPGSFPCQSAANCPCVDMGAAGSLP